MATDTKNPITRANTPVYACLDEKGRLVFGWRCLCKAGREAYDAGYIAATLDQHKRMPLAFGGCPYMHKEEAK